MFDRLATEAAAEPWLGRRGRHISLDFLIAAGDVEWLVCVREGRVESVNRTSFSMTPYRFAIRAGSEAWEQLLAPIPPPQRNDVLALVKHGLMRIEGDLQPFFANLLWFKTLLALPRRNREAAA